MDRAEVEGLPKARLQRTQNTLAKASANCWQNDGPPRPRSPDHPSQAVAALLLGRSPVGAVGDLFGPRLVCDPLLYAWGLVDLVVLFFVGIAHGSSSSWSSGRPSPSPRPENPTFGVCERRVDGARDPSDNPRLPVDPSRALP